MTGDKVPGGDGAIIDLSDLTLEQVMALPDGAVSNSLKRIFQDIDSPKDAVAGFQSAM